MIHDSFKKIVFPPSSQRDPTLYHSRHVTLVFFRTRMTVNVKRYVPTNFKSYIMNKSMFLYSIFNTVTFQRISAFCVPFLSRALRRSICFFLLRVLLCMLSWASACVQMDKCYIHCTCTIFSMYLFKHIFIYLFKYVFIANGQSVTSLQMHKSTANCK